MTPEIGIGTAWIGKIPPVGFYSRLNDLFRTASELGIQHLDTSRFYARGLAEPALSLSGFLRSDWRPRLVSKVGISIFQDLEKGGFLPFSAQARKSVFTASRQLARQAKFSELLLRPMELDSLLLHSPPIGFYRMLKSAGGPSVSARISGFSLDRELSESDLPELPGPTVIQLPARSFIKQNSFCASITSPFLIRFEINRISEVSDNFDEALRAVSELQRVPDVILFGSTRSASLRAFDAAFKNVFGQ